MYLYNFMVTDYEETHHCDFQWVSPVSGCTPPTQEQFVKAVMDEAIKLYSKGEHMYYGCDDHRNELTAFQQFLRWEFYEIIFSVNENTQFKTFNNDYVASVMLCGTDEEQFQKDVATLGIDIPPLAGKTYERNYNG